MKYKSTIIWYLFGMLFLTTSCLNIDEDLFEPINGNLIVKMYEQLDSINRVFTLLIETEKEYDCSNYVIDYQIEASDTLVTIVLKQIYKPNVCYTDRGPARAIIGFLNKDWQSQKIRIEMDNFSRSGIVYKDTSEYKLDMLSSYPLLVHNPVLKRVPENTIWGIIEYNSLSSKAYIDTFYMYLDSLEAQEGVYQDGDYNFFEVSDGEVVNPGSPNTNFSDVFLLNYENSFKYLVQLSNYVSYKSKDLQIRISSSDSEYHNTGYPY